MLFSDIIGQSRPKQFLSALAQSGRVPHALLFLGPTGGGSLALALAFAQMLQCERMGAAAAAEEGPSLFGDALPPEPAAPPAAEACGVCGACRKAAALVHPDVHFSFPTVGTNAVSTDFLKEWRAFLGESAYADANTWLQRLGAENKQGNITADEAREIIRKLTLKMFEGPYKVLIMWMPEYLKEEGNILLKLIEEPPENTLLLFVAEDAEKIIGTIQSRTQRVQLLPLNEADVMQGLMQKYGLGEEQAREIARVADGNFNAAIELMAETENNYHELFRDWMLACKANQMRTMIEKVDEIADMGRLKQKNLLGYALYVFRSCMLYNHGVYDKLISNTADQAFISKFSRFVTEKNIDDFASKFNDAIFHIERNANPKITLLNLSLQVEQLFKAA